VTGGKGQQDFLESDKARKAAKMGVAIITEAKMMQYVAAGTRGSARWTWNQWGQRLPCAAVSEYR
jgi:hypothetical protein